jgi:hypothetical protein
MKRYAEPGGVISYAAQDLVSTVLRKQDELIGLVRVMVGILFLLFLQLR